MLKCVEAWVYNRSKPSIRKRALVFIDGGSQTSYISDEMAKALRLSRSDRRETEVYTFGAKDPMIMLTDKVDFAIETLNQSDLEVSARATPTVTVETQMVLVQEEDIPDLDSRRFTWPTVYRKPDILLNSGREAKLDIRPIKELHNGFMLSSTRIGPVIWGDGKLKACSAFENSEELCSEFAGSALRAFVALDGSADEGAYPQSRYACAALTNKRNSDSWDKLVEQYYEVEAEAVRPTVTIDR